MYYLEIEVPDQFALPEYLILNYPDNPEMLKKPINLKKCSSLEPSQHKSEPKVEEILRTELAS